MQKIFIEITQQCIRVAPKVATVVIIFAFFWLIGFVVDLIIRRMGKRLGDMRKRKMLKLVGTVVMVVVCVFGAVTALGTVGINISALIAGMGLTGFALGFALKDALSNLLAGALVLMYQPFNYGDEIEVAGSKGKVMDIDLRYTMLEDEGKKILVPNNQLFTNKIVVASPSPHTRS